MVIKKLDILNTKQKNEILKLLIKEFKLPDNEVKNFKLKFQMIPLKSYIIALNKEKKIIGFLITVKRKMNYCGHTMNVLGLSYMAIAKDYKFGRIVEGDSRSFSVSPRKAFSG